MGIVINKPTFMHVGLHQSNENLSERQQLQNCSFMKKYKNNKTELVSTEFTVL